MALALNLTGRHRLLGLIEEQALTHGFIVSLMTFAVLSLPDRGRYDLGSMLGWLTASAPFPEEYRARLERETSLPPGTIFNAYGITESLLNTSLWPQEATAPPGSVGRAVPAWGEDHMRQAANTPHTPPMRICPANIPA
jgi:AMP-binding enzyme